MKIKTSELSGVQLDWAVFKAEYGSKVYDFTHAFEPSTDWTLGGPIIEREGIALGQTGDGWEATCDGAVYIFGQTPLIAAMRCYVASRLGEEVEIPEEIIDEGKKTA